MPFGVGFPGDPCPRMPATYQPKFCSCCSHGDGSHLGRNVRLALRSWRGPFFPRELMVKHQLKYYASQFSTAELNGVFYRTPTSDAVINWRDQTGADFVFSWKASKFITHRKRLSDQSVNSLELLESRLSLLGKKAGPILFQLPPQFEANVDRSLLYSITAQPPTVQLRIQTSQQVPTCDFQITIKSEYRPLPV